MIFQKGSILNKLQNFEESSNMASKYLTQSSKTLTQGLNLFSIHTHLANCVTLSVTCQKNHILMIDAVCIPISCFFQSSFTQFETKIKYKAKYRNNSNQSRYKGKCKWCKYERIVLIFQKKTA